MMVAVLLVLLGSRSIMADQGLPFRMAAGTVEYSIGGKKAVFVRIPDKHLTISRSCGSSFESMNCDAFRAMKKATLQGIAKKEKGANPGALVCKQLEGGLVVWGKDKTNNENTFCRFNDQSMIDNGSLSFYAHNNDRHISPILTH